MFYNSVSKKTKGFNLLPKHCKAQGALIFSALNIINFKISIYPNRNLTSLLENEKVNLRQ